MRIPQLVVAVLALAPGACAQDSSSPSTPDAPSTLVPAPSASQSSQAAAPPPSSQPTSQQALPTSVPAGTDGPLSTAQPSVRPDSPSVSRPIPAESASAQISDNPSPISRQEPQGSTPPNSSDGAKIQGGPTTPAGVLVVSSREPVVSSREPVVSSREPVVSSREPVVSSREPVVSSREPVVSSREPVVSSRGGDRAPEPSSNIPISNSIQGTRVQSNSPQEPSGSVASGQGQPSVAATTVGPQVSGVRGVNGTIGTASAGSSGAGSPGADGVTNTGLSPELATTVAFAAQPSDAFRAINETAIEAMPESTEPTPPDVSSPDQLHAELTVNIPEKAIDERNAKAIAVLETAYFEYFVNKDPAPVDKGKISIPDVISQCQNKYSEKLTRRKGLVDEVLDWVPLLSRDLRGFQNCRAVDSLEVGVYFHYMRASSTAERPNELESRVKAQVDTLNEALGAVKINFRFMALNWWEPKANEDWSKVTRHEGKLEEWQRRTRAPGKLVLTVWIVNGLRTSQKDNQELNSYATFPNEKLDEADGIVIEEARVQGGDATTLIHDVGHWLGLGHTFDVANQECVVQDGLTNATQTSGNRDVLYQCSQVTCAGGPAVEINNYMSYSSCRGKTPRDGFTTDQKARMFANALQFRRGYGTGECMPDGTAAVKKRSSMQDLLEGKCPDVDKQANILMNAPHSPAATVERSWSKIWAGLAAPWVLMTFF